MATQIEQTGQTDEADRQLDRQTERRTARQTDRQTETDKPIYRQRCIHKLETDRDRNMEMTQGTTKDKKRQTEVARQRHTDRENMCGTRFVRRKVF